MKRRHVILSLSATALSLTLTMLVAKEDQMTATKETPINPWIDGSLQTLSQKQLERAVFPFKPRAFQLALRPTAASRDSP